MAQWLADILKKISGAISGLIAFVTAVIGFYKLWDNDTGPVTIVLVGIGVISSWLACWNVWQARIRPKFGGKVTPRYPRACRFALMGMFLVPILTIAVAGYYICWRDQPPSKVILLVADFEGPEQQRYRVTDTLLAQLRSELVRYDDVDVETLGRVITEKDGSAIARAEDKNRKAAIVIWGWYGATPSTVLISTHFEILRPPEDLPKLSLQTQEELQTRPIEDLNTFKLQTDLSKGMANLTLFTVGVVRYSANDWDGAINGFSEALRQAPDKTPKSDLGTIYAYRGNAKREKGILDPAIEDYNQAIDLDPQSSLAYIGRGTTQLSKGNLDLAIEDLNKGLDLDPLSEMALNNRASAYFAKGDLHRAIDDYNRALALDPKEPIALANRGVAFIDTGNYDQAIADFTASISMDGKSPDTYNDRAITYRKMGYLDVSIADATKAIEINPKFAKAYDTRGTGYLMQGKYDQAIAEYNRAIELDPRGITGAAYNNRALASWKKNDTDQALTDYTKALEIAPWQAIGYKDRGKLYQQKGMKTQAIADFEKYLQLRPDAPDRAEVEQWLRDLNSK